jgi:predicted O-methyltransferase YrrM
VAEGEAPKQGIRKLFSREAVSMLTHRPALFARNLIQIPEYVFDRRHRTGPEAFRDRSVSEAEAVTRCTDASAAEYEKAVARMWRPTVDALDERASRFRIWAGREELLRVMGAIVSLSRPRVMVETGVALGFTTATILAAMERNGVGELHSIDLPAAEQDPDVPTGVVVPEELRNRWDLRLGDSRKLLGPLLEELGEIDIFLHDAFHTYRSQRREYRTVWPHLRSGGILASDDVDNPALVELADEVSVEPLLIVSESRQGPSAIGLLRKPGLST